MPGLRPVKVEVLLVPGASNMEDFRPLESDVSFLLRFVKMGEELNGPDIVIIPGTKNTISDYLSIKRAGYVNKIKSLAKKKTLVFGIAGGFQMLGTKIIDIKGSESLASQSDGFGFLPIVTRIMPGSVSSLVSFDTIKNGLFAGESPGSLKGFESHLGRTKYLNGSKPLFRITERHKTHVEIFDGAVSEETNAAGTYIHGIFNDRRFREYFQSAGRAGMWSPTGSRPRHLSFRDSARGAESRTVPRSGTGAG